MANVEKYLQDILDAVYGEEVRGSIHDAIEAMNVESTNAEAVAISSRESAKNYATAAGEAKDAAVAAQTAAETAQTAAEAAQTAAALSETNAAASETAAAASETAAATSETNAAASESNAAASESAAASSEANAAASETAAASSETNAAASETAASLSETNAQHWADVAQQYAQGGLHFVSTVTFANIPVSGMSEGDMYNISTDFITDNRFEEGAGIKVKAGTNIGWNKNNKWDILATGGLGGHVVKNDTTTFPNRSNLKIIGNVEVSDSQQDDETVVDVKGNPEATYDTYEDMMDDWTNIEDGSTIFVKQPSPMIADARQIMYGDGTVKDALDEAGGTVEDMEWSVWNAMTEAEKDAYSAGKKINLLNVPGAEGSIDADLMTLLWENPNPTAAFAAQTITLASDNYEMLLCIHNRGSSIYLKGIDQITIGLASISGAGALTAVRWATRISDTQFDMSDCKQQRGTEASTTNNSTCIPLKIYGIKKTISVKINAIAPEVSTSADKCMLSDGETSVEDAVEQINSDLSELLLGDGAGIHNAIYRGKYLGDTFTAEQSQAIQDGSFHDLYIGDYWTIGGVNWRIAHFDYWLHTGSTEQTNHHAVIVPDTNLYNTKMNTSHVTTGGYIGSAMYTTNLASAKATVNSAFGSAHVLPIKKYLTNSVSTNIANNWSEVEETVGLMNESMVYGGPVNSKPAADSINFNVGYEKTQLALFKLRPELITNRGDWWLRCVVSSSAFVLVNSFGLAYLNSASLSYGVRPAFAIY